MDTLESAPEALHDDPVILTGMLAETPAERLEALRDACHEGFAAALDDLLGAAETVDA